MATFIAVNEIKWQGRTPLTGRIVVINLDQVAKMTPGVLEESTSWERTEYTDIHMAGGAGSIRTRSSISDLMTDAKHPLNK